jgi:hypothetical protein
MAESNPISKHSKKSNPLKSLLLICLTTSSQRPSFQCLSQKYVKHSKTEYVMEILDSVLLALCLDEEENTIQEVQNQQNVNYHLAQ